MRLVRFACGALAVAIGIGLGPASRPAAAQGLGMGAGGGMPGMVGGSPMIIPYSGTFEGFMPGRMAGGSLSFRPRPSGVPRGGPGLTPLSGGMSGMSGLRRPGFGTGMGDIGRMPAGAGMGVMPPRIGYPFRQPAMPGSPSSTGPGMSM
jgi:hypothetical protein